MSDYTKRVIAMFAMLFGIAWAIAFAVVFTHDRPPTEPSSNYKFCIQHGGVYIENGIGEGFSCSLPARFEPEQKEG